MTLDDLIEKWAYAKEREKDFEAQRLQAEAQIVAMVSLPPHGTLNLKKIKIQVRKKETWDQDALNEMKARINFPFWPFQQQWKPIKKELDTLEENFAEKWRELSAALTVEPAKPTFVRGE